MSLNWKRLLDWLVDRVVVSGKRLPYSIIGIPGRQPYTMIQPHEKERLIQNQCPQGIIYIYPQGITCIYVLCIHIHANGMTASYTHVIAHTCIQGLQAGRGLAKIANTLIYTTSIHTQGIIHTYTYFRVVVTCSALPSCKTHTFFMFLLINNQPLHSMWLMNTMKFKQFDLEFAIQAI